MHLRSTALAVIALTASMASASTASRSTTESEPSACSHIRGSTRKVTP